MNNQQHRQDIDSNIRIVLIHMSQAWNPQYMQRLPEPERSSQLHLQHQPDIDYYKRMGSNRIRLA